MNFHYLVHYLDAGVGFMALHKNLIIFNMFNLLYVSPTSIKLLKKIMFSWDIFHLLFENFAFKHTAK